MYIGPFSSFNNLINPINLKDSVAADEMADSPVKVTFFAGAMARELGITLFND